MDNSDITQMNFELTGYIKAKYLIDETDASCTLHPADFELVEGGYYTGDDGIGYSATLVARSQGEEVLARPFTLKCHVNQFHKLEWLYTFDGEVTDDQLSYIFEPTQTAQQHQ